MKPKTGLVVGKFYPPHRGHKHLIETACAQVERLTVLVASKPEQTIPAELRAGWLREIHPGLEVRIIEDKVYDARQWAEHTVQEWLGYVPDLVFSSEEYGEEYARQMGCRHVMVDIKRQTVPCSGTLIRSNPHAYLDFLEPCVRSYYAQA